MRWALVVAVIAAISYGVYQRAQAAEERGRAQAADDRADRQAEVVDSVSREAARLDSILEARQAALARARDSTEALADSLSRQATVAVESATQAGDSLDATVDSLRVSVRPLLVPLVDVLDTQVQAERNAHQSVASKLRRQLDIAQTIVTQADSSAALCVRGRDTCRDRVRELETLVEQTTAARDRWREAANPGFFASLTNSWRQVLAGAAIGIVGYALLE